jgi:DNA polymerase III delta prime subunit
MKEIINENLSGEKIAKITSFQKPTLDIFVTLTNKANDQLAERKINVESYSGTPKIIIQIDRDVLELPESIQTSQDVEEYVEELLENEELTIKFENDGVLDEGAIGGIFRWFPNKDNLLLVATYAVDTNRMRFKKQSNTTYPIRVRTSANNNDQNRSSLGKLLYSELIQLKDYEREKLDIDYKRFLDKSYRPFMEFLYNERLSIRDPRFRPHCKYTKRFMENDDRAFLEVTDPPRQITEGGNQISARDENENTYISVRVSDYDESEQVIIIDEGIRVKDWPESGVIFLEGDMSSNRRKMQAVNLLRTRKNHTYAKLADVVIRPWGLPFVDHYSRSYFHSNISHENHISKAQAEATDLALSCDDISLIHGPPGTGKTTVIVEIIRHIVGNGGRVLMVAPTHVAVDNVLERVAHEKGVSAVRVGGREYMTDHLKKYQLKDRIKTLDDALPSFRHLKGKDKKLKKIQDQFLNQMHQKDQRYFENLVLEQSNLVCGTTIGIARYYENTSKSEINFDVLIIDEASKATVMEFLVPAVRARKWVLVGDHRQLPPYVNDQELRIYIQRYFENKEDEEEEDKSSQAQKESQIFHEKTEELIASLRRFHEELHALSEGDPHFHWNKLVDLMNQDRKAIKSIEEMVNLALGSCFHYFLQRIDESRNVYLTVQHRMPSILANFLDESIYAGNLKTSDSAAQHGLKLPAIPDLGLKSITGPLAFVSTENCKNPHESPGRRKGYQNVCEAEAIADIVAALTQLDTEILGYTEEEPLTIGVITYYADQSRTIVNKLKTVEEIQAQRGWRFTVENKPIKIRVSIVDRFQGQEQDIVLLSLTRSNTRGGIGFLKNLQRINVSLSRAKQNLLVIGNHRFFNSLRGENQTFILKELATYTKKHKLIRKIKEGKSE